MLRLVDVGVRYGAKTVLASVTFDLPVGGRLAVLGPSGSGKSTLLRAIAGLEPISTGRVEWHGADLARTPAHERDFGLMFQDYALFPQRDVGANVAFGLELRGLPRAETEQRVKEMLELVGLPGYERRPVTQLSGGEQQRVALARAMAPRPRLLMLDEPLGALDQTLRARLLEDLDALLARLDLPVIYVTHDQHEALAVGERVALLNAGRVEALMPPAELWRSPPTEFAARFIGLTNIVPFEPTDDGRARTPWGLVPLAGGVLPGRARLLIRPEALTPDPGGSIEGTVEARIFRGDHASLRVRAADSSAPPLDVRLDAGQTIAVGQPIRLRVDPDGIVLLS
ncbi:ABC transporter ATP-binding protein [soil metagenome]